MTFTYSSGTLVSVSDPSGATLTLAYGTSGDLSSVTYPDPDGSGPLTSPVVSYGYDGSHRVTSVTDPRGNARTFSYNSDGSLAWEKDALLNQTTYTYTSSYTKITDPRGNYRQYNYASGRVSSETDEDGYTTSYAYDSANNKTSITDQASKVWSYTFDSVGNVLTVTDPLIHRFMFLLRC